MREIKFRAWHKDGKKMSEPWDLFEGFDGECMYSAYYDGEQVLSYPSEVELMQYTGLKDKNGKEIYEGDIVSNELNKGKFWKIEWNNGGFDFFCDGRNSTDPKIWETIGNIYENKDLIKN